MRQIRTAAAFMAALVLGVTLGTWGGPAGEVPFVDTALASTLESFDDCEELGTFLSEAAAALAEEPYEHFDSDVVVDFAEQAESPVGERAAATQLSAAAADGGGVGGGGHSTTNVQEVGIDEPDLVKTDGGRVVAVGQGRLHVLTTDGSLRLAGSVSLPGGWGHELLLDGDRVLVLSSGEGAVQLMDDLARSSMPAMGNATLTLVDIADPVAPQVISSMEMDGSYVSARLVDGTARVVLRSYAHTLDGVSAEDALPQFRTDGADPEPIVGCDRVLVPPEPLGPGMTTVVSVDLQGPLAPTGAATVVADASTVYATADRLYVAWQRWDAEAESTEIHAFDITDAAQARYIGAGTVDGYLLNQWALSRHGGHLRVATTLGDSWGGGSHSALTVLAETAAGLVQVGRVDGLGPDERIYAVRYLGDIGFVVTFRETDPLYTLDLSDPADPRVIGELKIPGFSNYLHPVGDGYLLGVGQDADEQGRRLGVAASLFDVRDLANPQRIQQLTVGLGDTAVEWDHRAFLWWGPASLAVLPVQLYTIGEHEEWAEGFSGAVGLSVSTAGIAEAGRVGNRQIERNLVVGDLLLSYSQEAITVTDLATFTELDVVSFR